ncbi:MAG: thiol peroxidase [Deltaproteobacteria bacterium]|jgi:thiol peroxidase|nr:thiol peroxidase [Deltaproteobacteria bacterium]
MTQIKLDGNSVNTVGTLPEKGNKAPDFTLVNGELERVGLANFKSKKIVMNIFPSLDTPTCATSVRKFNEMAGKMDNTKVLCISKDLPFAQNRFCGAQGLDNVITLSDYETGEFGKKYGVEMVDGPLKNLLSRAVVILDSEGKVIYTEQVQYIVDEPDYQKALDALGVS